MTRKLRESFVGHPGAILFLRISGERVFQQPQAITPTTVKINPRHSYLAATTVSFAFFNSGRSELPPSQVFTSRA